ncbi:hypothetical protein QYE76_001784 [Lolium multiflorum]|uniref:Retrotransposon gag domain-containing protein n=1 Tax=Lolium multiflorum TaxID=4521 RepID=A0AAD8VYX6_LOLMU|nr:hypothetical protein QYE76_001784 [Lolium multiflorum]
MVDGTPVTYEELPDELKKRYDEIKVTLEADLIGSFQRTRSHGIRWKGFSPQGALDGIDLSAPSEERTRGLRQEINYLVAHSLHRHSENLVNVLERVALRVIQEIMSHQYSPSGPALGTHQGELPLQSRPPLPYALAAPAEVPATPAFVVYKIGGDPSDYQFLAEAPKEIPQGYACTGSDGSSSIEHIGRYLAQLGPASVSDQLRVRLFSQSLTGSAFGWYTSLPANSIQSWKQLEEQFHMQYHSEASESSIADLAQLRQKRGETVTEYIQRFRNLRNRCYSVRITEKEAVELAVAGLATQLKDMASQADYPSLAHMVQKLSAYEQRHPDLYQDKFKRAVVLVDAEEDEVPAGDQEVAVAEWTRGGTPVSCKWVKPPGPPRGFDFDVTKTEQIFDLLLKEKQLTIPEGLKFPTAQELNGKPYCKFHNSLSHATNDCRVWRQHIQAAIEKGRLIFNQYAMKVDTQPFPAVNMVEVIYPEGCQPGPTFSINMVGPGNHSGKDGDEGSCSHSKDTEEAAPRDRLHHDGKRYVTEGEVKNIRYQRPLSDHLLNKYVSQYDQRRRSNYDDEGDRLAREARRHRRQDRDEEEHERRATEKSREQDDNARHWDCPFFRHSGIQE